MIGQLLVLPDYPSSYASFIDSAAHLVTSQVLASSAEQGSRIAAAQRICSVCEDVTGNAVRLEILDQALNVLHTNTSLIIPSMNDFAPVTNDGVDTFYVMQIDSGPATIPTVKTIDINGVVGPTTWTLPAFIGSQYYESMAVDRAETILYYGVRPGVNANSAAVHRHDLLANAPLSDLVVFGLPNSVGQDLLCLSDGSILIPCRFGNVAGGISSWEVRRYSPAGALLVTYPIGTSYSGSFSCPRIAVEDDEQALWVFSFPIDATTTTGRFTQYTMATGAVLQFFDLPTFTGTPTFTFRQDNRPTTSQSCPLLFLAAAAPGCPGLVTVPRVDGLPYTPATPAECLGTGNVTTPRVDGLPYVPFS